MLFQQQLDEEARETCNFDMNEEFNPAALRAMVEKAERAKRAEAKSAASGGSRKSLVTSTHKEFEVIEYNQVAVKGLYFLFLLMVILVSVDFGIFAAASVEIKQGLALDNLRFGALQTMVFLGIALGKNYQNPF